MAVMKVSFQSIRVLGFGGSVILGYWERFARGGVAWPACPPEEGRGAWRAMGCGPARASAYFASDSRYSNSNPNRWTIGRVRWPCPAGSSPVRVSSSPELMFHSRRARRAIRIRRVGRSAVCVRVMQVRVRSADRAENREPIELRSDRAESRPNQSLLSIVIKFRNQNLHPWVLPLE